MGGSKGFGPQVGSDGDSNRNRNSAGNNGGSGGSRDPAP